MVNFPTLGGNWVDLVIIVLLIYFASEAFRYGFWGIMVNFASFLGSILISLRAYKFVAGLLKTNFNMSASLNNALGFLIVSVVAEILLDLLFTYLVSKLPKNIRESKIDQYLGLLPALGEGIVVIAFLLTIAIALPIRPDVKKAVSESKIGGVILKETSGVEAAINEVFGGAINDALTYLTIEPKSNETIALKNGIDHLSVDKEAEVQMFTMVNRERTGRGIPALTISDKIVPIAEAYARDMWERHYFSHYSPEGKTVADRFSEAGISYSFIGENLALAPTVQTAMTGLMNSEGHRTNILEPRFKKVGIGVVDNGIYGKMFVQEFSN